LGPRRRRGSTPRLNENDAITPLRSGVTAHHCGVPDVPPRRVGEFLMQFVHKIHQLGSSRVQLVGSLGQNWNEAERLPA